jgi:serine phosphatase RsbU (regulator of sigma subunit)
MSDGIAEATDSNGQLFGFERVHELLRVTTSPAGIAAAAQSFGRQDDITVLTVERAPVLEAIST